MLYSVAAGLGTVRGYVTVGASHARVAVTGAMRAVGHHAVKAAHVARESFQTSRSYVQGGVSKAWDVTKAHPGIGLPVVALVVATGTAALILRNRQVSA